MYVTIRCSIQLNLHQQSHGRSNQSNTNTMLDQKEHMTVQNLTQMVFPSCCQLFPESFDLLNQFIDPCCPSVRCSTSQFNHIGLKKLRFTLVLIESGFLVCYSGCLLFGNNHFCFFNNNNLCKCDIFQFLQSYCLFTPNMKWFFWVLHCVSV